MNREDFKGSTPEFALEDFFAGHTRAWGIFEDRFGRLRREFVVDIAGTVDGDRLTLVEDFVYGDGETEQRIWTIRRTGRHSYQGRADGVIGTARGTAHGKAVNWRYDFALPINGRPVRVHFDDWMFLQQDGRVMVNRATVSKFGIALGRASIFFQKVDETSQPAATAPTSDTAAHPGAGEAVASETASMAAA